MAVVGDKRKIMHTFEFMTASRNCDSNGHFDLSMKI